MQIDLEQICCFWNKAERSKCEITLKPDEVDNRLKKNTQKKVLLVGW